MLKRSRISALFALLAFAPFAVAAESGGGYDLSDYQVDTTESLVDICSVPDQHPAYNEASSFCYGFIAGVGQYHRAIASTPETHAIFCPSDDVTRVDVVNAFLDFAGANPQYQQAPPVETLVRALVNKWPCGN